MPTYSGTAVVSVAVNGYCTLADLRSAPALNFEVSYTTDDALLSNIITAISREIDRMTGRFFYQTTDTRYFTAIESDLVDVDDLVSVTTLQTDDGSRAYATTWAATDYDLWPFNAALQSEPYRLIKITPQGDYSFNRNVAKGVKLAGVFGWPAVPETIAKACLLWCERYYKRLSAPLGTASMSQLGMVSTQIPTPDPDIEQMIMTYRLIV